jgi:rhodanese-related sulfurtransferase
MSIRMHVPNPEAAQKYFQDKIAFTAGPGDVDYYRKEASNINIVDVRAAEDYALGHIPGAISLPEDEWATLKGLDKNKVNVLYCYSQVCHLAARAAITFSKHGFSVVELEGGFDGWKQHALEIEVGAMNTIQKRAS